MAQLEVHFNPRLNWKWWGALFLFGCGFLGFLSGVEVSERPGMPGADILTKAYYAFGLFVLGGMDLGTPSQGPLYGKALLWIAYFGAPILTASAVIETVFHVLQPYSWHLRRIKGHFVIVGSGNLTLSFLKRIREELPSTPIVIIANDTEQSRLEELQSFGNVRIIVSVGDHRFLMRRIRMERAHRVLLLSENDIVNCEAASSIMETVPELSDRIIFHVADLRLLRILQDTQVVQACTSFNSYQMAAAHLARDILLKRFRSTQYRDTVVLAGFGRFGQSILEELEQQAAGEFHTVAIIDTQATRNTLIADEQVGEDKDYIRHTVEGDIDDPQVWQALFHAVTIVNEEPVFILATGSDEKNIRAAIWLRQQYADALIISRSMWPSAFATQVCAEHDILSINMADLMEGAIPHQWYRN